MMQQKMIQKKQESRPRVARQPVRSQISARMQDRRYSEAQGIIGNHGVLRHYAHGSQGGQELIAREPTHVIQKTGVLYTTGGLKSDATEDEFLGGRTVGESIGDVARPVGTVLGNVVGSVAGAVTGISISTSTNTGPTWNNHGSFDWRVGFSTTGRNGWIVQKIANTYRAQDAAGSNLGGRVPTPQYWEAWAVNAAGNVTPNIGADNDRWIRPNRGNNTQGHWSMTGSVYFTTTDPATQGFVRGSVPDAGNLLLSTTTAPGGLGIARLHRYAQGTWDSTGATPTHTGSAGP